MAYLIDTDWVIDYLVDDAAAVSFLDSLTPGGIAISIITYVEVMEGIVGDRDRRRAEAVFRSFLRQTRVLGVSRSVARRTAEIRADLRRRRLQITPRETTPTSQV